ncbi:sulfatase-like hydrolase/transferase [Pontiellaceae bacterium B12227]|nr:sulfatase-like hydrolase/transferase [Pontiellaceae bacterium B12227]
MSTKGTVAILAFVLCGSAFAANYVYQGNGTDPDDWFDDANWSDAGGANNWPTAVDNALFTSEKGMSVFQAVPAHSQFQVGRGATNTVTIATGGVVSNANQTVVGIVTRGEGHLIVDGGSLVTKSLRLNVYGGATLLSPGSSVELKSGTIHVDASFGGANAGDLDLGLDESATLSVSGGSLIVDNNLDFTAGRLEVLGEDGSIYVGNQLKLGTTVASETELDFVLGAAGGVSTIVADAVELTGMPAITINGSFVENTATQNLVLIELQNDAFSASEFDALSSGIALVNMDGELSLNASSNQLLFVGAPVKRPNIIVIYTDDHGFTDLGIHGIDGNVRTPVLDSLAAGGALMANGYSTSPQCVPSRAGIMSGRIQNTFGTRQNGDIWGPCPVPLDVPTIAERLVELGTYRTGIVGKWHLEPPPDTVAGIDYPGTKDDYYPEARGFQEYFRNPVSPYVANFDLAGNTVPHQSISDARNRVIVQGEAAEAFIERNQDQPFFLYLTLFGPHLPRMAKTDSYYLDFPELDYPHYSAELDDIRRLGLGLVWAIDDAVGGVMQKLRDLGLEEDTLILFAGDNGAQPKFWDGVPGSGTLDKWTGNENIPLRGEKGSLWEGGVKVPMLAYWKGHIPTNQVIEEPVWTLDFTATVLKLAGGAVPSEFDGVDILPRLTGQENAVVRTKELFWDWGQEISLRDDDWKIHRIGSRKSLFNLADDPFELYDLKYVETNRFAEMEMKLMARYDALPANGQSLLLGDGNNWYVSGAPTDYPADPRFMVPYTNSAPAPYPAPLAVLNDPLLDSDGDGMSDTLEVAIGRNANDPADLAFGFNVDDDYEGWTPLDFLNWSQVANGALVGEAQSNQGKFEHYGFSFNGSAVSNLLVRVHSPGGSSLTYRWGTAASNAFHQARTISVPYAVGETNTVVIPVGGHAQWDGQTITRMRLNPVNTLSEFRVDWIRASDGDLDGDGLGDRDESIAGTDGASASDCFRAEGLAVGTNAVVAFDGKAGRSYVLLRSENLISNVWEAVDVVIGADGLAVLADTNTLDSAAYRIQVERQ